MPTIDQLCDEFETDWRSGKQPRIEEYLDRIAAADRGDLNQQLVALQEELSRGQFPTTKFIGLYKMLQKIGEGGMGVVWLAEQKDPVRRRVAVKLVKSDKNSDEIRARFDAERQALAMMNHPNIAKVLDAGTNEGRPYYVMELIEGVPLTEYCDTNRLTIEARLRLFIQLCNAVSHAHRKGIIHRDIKPSNILVGSIDDQPVLKLIDFGLAKAAAHQFKLTDKTLVTEYGQVLGTLRYISPEQAELNPLTVDQRSDVYSLGVVLYELLCGSTPLDESVIGSSGRIKILEFIQNYETPRPSDRLANTPNELDDSSQKLSKVSELRRIQPRKLVGTLRNSGLDWVCLKALDRDPNRRYSSANKLRNDIECFLDEKPVSAGPPSIGVRISRLLKKNRKPLRNFGIGTTAVIGAILLTLWFTSGKTEIGNGYGKYVADIRQAWSNWNSDEIDAAWRVFEGVDQNLVGWEYGFVETEFKKNQSTHFYHNAAITRLSYSAEHQLVATGSYDGRVAIHRYPKMELVAEFELTNVTSVDISSDGKLVSAGTHEGEKRIWDIESKKLIAKFQFDNDYFVAFSPDCKTLASGQNCGRITIWDVKTGDLIREIESHEEPITCLAWFSGSDKIVAGTYAGQILVHDVLNGTTVAKLDGLDSKINSIALSTDDSMLASCGPDDRVNLFELETGKLIHQLRGHQNSVNSVSFSSDRKRLYTGGGGEFDKKDAAIRIWDVASGKQIGVCKGHANTVTGIGLTNDGKIISGSYDSTIKIWDVAYALNHNFHHQLTPSEPITRVAVSNDGESICVAGYSNAVNVFNMDFDPHLVLEPVGELTGHGANETPKTGFEAFAMVNHAEPRASGFVTSAVFISPTRIATAGSDDQVLIRDLKKSGRKSTLTFKKIDKNSLSGIQSLAVTLDQQQIIASCNDGKIRSWDLVENKLLCTFDATIYDVTCIAVSPDGKLIAGGGRDGMLGVWHIETGKSKWLIKSDHERILCVSFSNDGSNLFVGGINSCALVIDSNNGNLIRKLIGHSGSVTGFQSDSSGRRIFSVATDGYFRVWNSENGDEILTHEVTKNAAITSMAAIEDSSIVVLSTSNGELYFLRNKWAVPDGHVNERDDPAMASEMP